MYLNRFQDNAIGSKIPPAKWLVSGVLIGSIVMILTIELSVPTSHRRRMGADSDSGDFDSNESDFDDNELTEEDENKVLLYDKIDAHIRKTIPQNVYVRGCHVISTVAEKILSKQGIKAEVKLVGCWKPHPVLNEMTGKEEAPGYWIPHFIVWLRDSREILDFKRLVYMNGKHPDIRPTLQENGYYPSDPYFSGEQYNLDPQSEHFPDKFPKNYRDEFERFQAALPDLTEPSDNYGALRAICGTPYDRVQHCIDTFALS